MMQFGNISLLTSIKYKLCSSVNFDFMVKENTFNSLTHSHTMIPFDAPGKQAF